MKLKFIFILVLMILLGSNLLAATQEEVIGSFIQKITGQYHIGKCKVLINNREVPYGGECAAWNFVNGEFMYFDSSKLMLC